MAILTVKNLCKSYPNFTLQDVSFSLEPGYIMGFIGKNGAGKTTTIKSIYKLIHFDSGEITLFGKKLEDTNESELKQDVSLMLGGLDIYSNFKLCTIKKAIAPFYHRFDDEKYDSLIQRFSLDEKKKFKELSNGMKTKFLLSLAMSHHAKLLILDEPTSGLDPFSRDEVLSEFQNYIKDGEHSIIFSTQIISDLEAVADYITYIKNGKIILSDEKDAFVDNYRLIITSKAIGEQIPDDMIIGIKETPYSFEALIKKDDEDKLPSSVSISKPTIEQIMILTERGKQR